MTCVLESSAISSSRDDGSSSIKSARDIFESCARVKDDDEASALLRFFFDFLLPRLLLLLFMASPSGAAGAILE